ncbi:GAF domain-containing protein [Candidatus Villigracilis saccharophilus]|uniref:GAF domain-containing protein n=1 Tax=Candidatus Villigracilis saccharophilus TaxID=3140684 RepID=UPI0031356C4D|nr:GAF domain-containing protein [Anaerolineales bacterium]
MAFDYKSWRNGFILIILRLACVLGLGLLAFSLPNATSNDLVLFISLYSVLFLVTIFPAPYTARAIILLLMIYAIGTNAILAWGPWLDGNVFFVALIILSGLLFDQRIDILAVFISIFTFATIGIMQQLGKYHFSAPGVPTTTPLDWIAYTVNFSVLSVILVIAIARFKNEFARIVGQTQSMFQTLIAERSQLENKVRERTEELEAQTNQLRTSTTVARTIAEIQDVSMLLGAVTDQISEKFEYYHVGLYILDEQKKIAFLQAASSTIGKQLIGQGFRVESDRRNALNKVVELNRAEITSDIEDPNFIRDPNFPITRSRMMLPLAVRGNVIGVLDLHSDQPKAFGTQDAEILQTLADLAAISFDNARLLNETKNLVNQLEVNTSFQTRKTWLKLTTRQKPAYQYTPAGVRPLFSKDKVNIEGMLVPLVLYGETIGTIKLKRKGGISEWSDRERLLVEKIADQVALALENSRLVEEAQKSALRDQMIANISTRVRETLDVESVIRTAATELRRVFDLKEAEINIGPHQPESGAVRKNANFLRLK